MKADPEGLPVDRQTKVYWLVTGVFAASMAGGAVLDVAQAERVAEVLRRLGYPLYFGSLLGVWKLLGVAVVLAPAMRRAKEWAYAGFFINLTGATLSHLVVDGLTVDVFVPMAILALALASYSLRPAARRLVGPAL